MEVIAAPPVVVDQIATRASDAPSKPDATATATPVDTNHLRKAVVGLRLVNSGPQQPTDPNTASARLDAERSRANGAGNRVESDRHEDQSTRELRDGFATDRTEDHHHRHHGHDRSPEIDDDMDMGM